MKILKRFFVFLFFVSLIFINDIKVYSFEGGVTGGSYVPPSNSGTLGVGSGLVAGYAGTVPVAYGYRITVVYAKSSDKTGRVNGTYSVDYISDWGGGWTNITNTSANLWGHKYSSHGFNFYTEPKSRIDRNKNDATTRSSETVNIDSKSLKKEYILENAYNADKYGIKEKIEDESKFKCGSNTTEWSFNYSKSNITNAGCGFGGDKRIGNNFSRFFLYFLQKAVDAKDDYAESVFGDILKDCGISGDTAKDRIFNAKEYYLIVEPLMAVARRDGFFAKSSGIYYGTISDLYNIDWKNDSFLSGGKTVSVDRGFVGRYFDYYLYNNFTYINPVVWNTPGFDDGPLETCPENENPNLYDTKKDFNINSASTGYGCAGAFTVFVGDMTFDEKCKETAKTNLSNLWDTTNKNLKSDITSRKKYYENLTGEKEDGTFTIDDPYYADFKDICFSGNVDSSQNDYGLNMKDCYQISYDYVTNIGYNSDSPDLCAAPSCEEALNTIEKTFGTNPHSKEKEPTTPFDIAVQYLHDNYSSKFSPTPTSTSLLQYKLYSSLRINPECEKTIPDCPTSTNISCKDVDVVGHFTISDNSDTNTCIKGGVSYTSSSSNDNFQTSLDGKYNSNVYCEEKVEFDFPGKPKETKAGKLLSWGVKIVDGKYVRKIGETNEFGTMKVTRKCYLDEYNKDDTRAKDSKIYTTWPLEVSPNIEFKYNDKASEQKGTLKTELINFKVGNSTIANAIFKDSCTRAAVTGADELVSSNEALSECITDYVCTKDDCSDAYTSTSDKSFTSIATYNIVYSDDLKWYSDKTDQYHPKDDTKVEKDDDENIDPKYILMGYGVPTSLFSASCNYDLNAAVVEEKETDNSGELSISVSNIGSKTDSLDPSKYHFDELLHMNLVYGESGKLVKGITDDKYNKADDISEENLSSRKLYYNCPFKVQNNIFGYEEGQIGDTIGCKDKPDGLDVVFRTVQLMDSSNEDDLTRAFPGRSGIGRYIGKNWSILDEKIIYSVLTSDIYKEEKPLYHIELTPGKIRDIRKNNKELRDEYNVDPYVNMDKLKKESTEEDTYIFSKISDWDNLKTVYDFDGDGIIDATDASSMLYCNASEKHKDDKDWEEYCKNYNGADGHMALKIYADASTKIEDGIGVHATSIYLDTLREKYGLDGLCMQFTASERAEKYKNTNGCNYPGRLTVYDGTIDPHDLNGDGVVNSSDAQEAMLQGDEELGKTILEEAAKSGAGGGKTSSVDYSKFSYDEYMKYCTTNLSNPNQCHVFYNKMHAGEK